MTCTDLIVCALACIWLLMATYFVYNFWSGN